MLKMKTGFNLNTSRTKWLVFFMSKIEVNIWKSEQDRNRSYFYARQPKKRKESEVYENELCSTNH